MELRAERGVENGEWSVWKVESGSGKVECGEWRGKWNGKWWNGQWSVQGGVGSEMESGEWRVESGVSSSWSLCIVSCATPLMYAKYLSPVCIRVRGLPSGA